MTSFPAPAKLNLFLHVTGRRADGYHLLQTVFRFIDLADLLTFEVTDERVVTRGGALVGIAAEDDLCVRAARLLQQRTDCRRGVRIRLEKRIPIGGGLGGGSSDAATTLLALNALWELDVPRTQLQQWALELGADVPVFVFGANAWAEGIGEELRAIDLPPAIYLVLAPPVMVSTGVVFADPGLTRSTKPIKIADFSAGYARNDLTAVVQSRYPEVGRYLMWLGRYGVARMSGSGSCVFAEFSSIDEAQAAHREMPAEFRGWVVRGLQRHPLAGL